MFSKDHLLPEESKPTKLTKVKQRVGSVRQVSQVSIKQAKKKKLAVLRARQTKTAASPEVCEFLEESSDEALIGTAVKQQEAPQLKVLSEEVSLEALEIMIEHAGELNISPEQRNQLILYRGSMDGTCRAVTYYPSSNTDLIKGGRGRWYADGGLSLQSFSRPIRHTLCKSLTTGETIYDDVDMVNCHPILLLQLCQKKSWPCARLAEYVSNREEIIASVMMEYKVNRADAKHLFLRLLYGGSFRSWATETVGTNLIDSNASAAVLVTEYPSPMKVLFDFQEELSRIRTCVWNDAEFKPFRDADTNETVKQPAESFPPNSKSRLLSLVLQDIEHRLLMAMQRFFTDNGWRVGVLVFDGLMVYRYKEKPLSKDVLDECARLAAKNTGWSIQLEVKPMTDAIELLPYHCRMRADSERVWCQRYLQEIITSCISKWRYNSEKNISGFEHVCKTAAIAGVPIDVLRERMTSRAGSMCAEFYGQQEDGNDGNDGNDNAAECLKYGAITELEAIAYSDNPARFLEIRPILDLRCPYDINDLLEARDAQTVQYLAPKVIARVTGSKTEQWVKKTRLPSGPVRFVPMSDGLKILRGKVWASLPSDATEAPEKEARRKTSREPLGVLGA